MTPEKATVFVVDDDLSVRRSLARLIRALGLGVETYASAAEYLRRAPREGHGCVLLDLRMPGMSGLELQEAMGREEHRRPVIFLTGHGDIPASVRAMKQGAVDFLQKPVEDAALEQAIRAALERDRGQREQHRQAREIQARLDTLTPREREVLEQVIAGEINKRIAAGLGITEKTVKVHRGHLMRKMAVGSVAELVRICDLVGVLPRDRS